MATKRNICRTHIFRFKFEDANGVPREFIARTVVHRAKKAVELPLTADDVRRSILLKGVGNTQTCSVAVCGKAHPDVFPHPVEGFIDVYYRRMYVVSKLKNGLPSECYVYEHKDKCVRLNDTPGGQRKLLKHLEANGPHIIHLRPAKRQTGGKSGPHTGTGQTRYMSKGAAARYAVALFGGVPPVTQKGSGNASHNG